MPPPGQQPRRIAAPPPRTRNPFTPSKTPAAPKKTARKIVGPYEDVLRPGGRSEVPVDQQLEHVKRNYFDPANPAKPEQQRVVVQRLQTWATKNPSNAKAAAFARTPAMDRPRGTPLAPAKPERDRKVTHIAAMGIPIAQSTPDLVKLLKKLDPGERTNVIAGFPNEGRSIGENPRWEEALRKMADEKGNDLGPNPTDKELFDAALGEHKGKTILGGVGNFIKGAAVAPVGAFAGGVAVGQAARAAVGGDLAPAREIAAQQVDFLKGFKDPDKLYADPFGYTLGAYAAVRGGAGLAGRAARGGALGASAKGFASQAGTERLVLPPSRGIETAEGAVPSAPRVQVGTYAKNPIDLAAQRLLDKGRESSPMLADRAVGKAVRKQIGLADTLNRKAEADLTKPVFRGLSKLSRAEQRAVIFAHYGRASKPSEMVSFYQRAVDDAPTPDNRAALQTWKSISKKAGDEITPKMQTTLDAMREAGVKADDIARQIKDPMGRRAFADESLERGRGLQAAIVRSEHGDQHAQDVLDLEAQAQNLRKDAEAARTSSVPRKVGEAVKVEQARLQAGRDVEIRALKKQLARVDKLKKAPPGKRPQRGLGPAAITQMRNRIERLESTPPTSAKITSLEKRRADHPDSDALEGQAHQAEVEAQQAMRDFLASRGDDQPGYVTSRVVNPDKPKQGQGTAGFASLSGEAKPKLGGATKRSEGILLRTGKANVSPEAYLGQIARNTKVKNQLDIWHRVMAQNAVRDAKGMRYDPNEWVARRLDVADHQVAAQERQAHSITEKARAIDEMGDETAGDRSGAQLAQGWAENLPRDGQGKAIVPDDGEWILVRKSARDEFDGRMRIQDSKLQAALNGTRAWRWMTLNARPAWLAANIVGNTVMAGLGGTGLKSTSQAIGGKYADVIPGQIKNSGIFARALSPDANLTSTRGMGVARRALGEANPMSLGVGAAIKQGLRRSAEEIGRGPIRTPTQTILRTPQNAARAVRFVGNLAAEANIRHENMLRDATYLSKAIPEAKRRVHGGITARFRKVNDEVMAELESMRKAEETAPVIATHVADFLGDLSSHSRYGDALTLAAPFWRWIAFISKQTLVTLPVKHPARALLLHQLGELGLTTSEQMGMLNPAYVGGLPMGQDEEGRTKIQPTGAFNVWATPSQLLGGASGNFSGLAGSVNPFAGIGMEVLTGRDPEGNIAENRYGEAIVPQSDPTVASSPNSASDRLDLLKNRLRTVVPFGSLLDPSFGEADTGDKRVGGRPSIYSEPELGERLFGYGLGYKPRGIDLAENQRRKRTSYARNLSAQARARRKAKILADLKK